MAKPPLRQAPDLDLVTAVEKWIDRRIPDNATEFQIERAFIERQFANLCPADWEELKNRYRNANWANVVDNHWTDKENGDGPFFRLSI